ncbi:MAG: hypothetical protein BJ554DRAFT_2620 [Olpidium bornovanus]|uniref:Uncharacterized protein n=1 Tax=Olpidium bornovanus TaxID=278681 RepID=A0A8H8DGA8_9FUNG|nr:MAG: hypothetical protein BJ554DRAFT_2620 [Olpidium bornovanus]
MTREKGTLTVTVVQDARALRRFHEHAKGIPKTDLMGFGDADPFIVFTVTPGLPVGDLPKLAVDAKNDKVQRTQAVRVRARVMGRPVIPEALCWPTTGLRCSPADCAQKKKGTVDQPVRRRPREQRRAPGNRCPAPQLHELRKGVDLGRVGRVQGWQSQRSEGPPVG